MPAELNKTAEPHMPASPIVSCAVFLLELLTASLLWLVLAVFARVGPAQPGAPVMPLVCFTMGAYLLSAFQVWAASCRPNGMLAQGQHTPRAVKAAIYALGLALTGGYWLLRT